MTTDNGSVSAASAGATAGSYATHARAGASISSARPPSALSPSAPAVSLRLYSLRSHQKQRSQYRFPSTATAVPIARSTPAPALITTPAVS
jgi:hypothetical protein